MFKITPRPSLLILLFSYFLVCVANSLQAQLGIFIQIEGSHSIETIKFMAGDVIEFKTNRDGNWRKEQIKKILVDEQMIMFEYDLLSIEDFTALRLTNKPFKIIGNKLISFGVGWTLAGIFAGIFTDFDFRGREVAIGGSALLIGFIFKSFFKYDIYKFKKGVRLRIIDTRFKV